MDIYLSSHEEHTLMRRFDHNGDGVISVEEFYNTLASIADNWVWRETQWAGGVTEWVHEWWLPRQGRQEEKKRDRRGQVQNNCTAIFQLTQSCERP